MRRVLTIGFLAVLFGVALTVGGADAQGPKIKVGKRAERAQAIMARIAARRMARVSKRSLILTLPGLKTKQIPLCDILLEQVDYWSAHGLNRQLLRFLPLLEVVRMCRSVRAAAEAGAMAGAGEVCHEDADDCWAKMRNVALSALEGQRFYCGGGKVISLTPGELSRVQASSVWDLRKLPSRKGLMLTVERGWWRRGKGGRFEFESMEDEPRPWHTRFPGIPRFLAANGVRVMVACPQATGLWSWLFNRTLFVLGSNAVATAAENAEASMAPFAVPACALLNNEGEFQEGKNLCLGDRLFTAANHYCPADDPECGVRPSFSYNPSSPALCCPDQDVSSCINNEWPLCSTANPDGNAQTFSSSWYVNEAIEKNHDFGWHNPSYAGVSDVNISILRMDLNGAVSDHFGLVGLPGVHKNLQETDVRSGINGALGAIGDRFTVLESGLTQSDSESVILGRMDTASGGINGQDTDIGALASNTVNISVSAGPDVVLAYPPPPVTPWPDTVSHGLCDSPVIEYKCMVPSPRPFGCTVAAGTELPLSDANALKCCDQLLNKLPFGTVCTTDNFEPYNRMQRLLTLVPRPVTSSQYGVWKTLAAVVADASGQAAPCRGLLDRNGIVNPGPNPPLTSAVNPPNFQIIGFLELNIFDVSIDRFDGASRTTDGPIQQRIPCPAPAQDLSTFGPAKWLFDPDQDGTANECNMVRARIDCKTPFVPSSNPTAGKSPRLVQ